MIEFLKSFTGMFNDPPPPKVPEDPTLYQIETSTHKYCGKIMYQDDMIIKLKTENLKAVKILKANINKITIVETELA